MQAARLESAVPVGTDPRAHARTLSRLHDAAVAGARTPGRRVPGAPRPVIEDSWRRVQTSGLDPDGHGSAPEPLGREDLEARREASGFLPALQTLRGGLVSIADEALHIMVVVDAGGRILWRDGSSAVRRRADGLGFVEGAAWDEGAVGTNAIGTALVARRPVQVYSAEHYVRSHHSWTCAAAPVHDPRTGRLLGVVDVSGPAATVHASTLALVDAVARLAEQRLHTEHQAELVRLRAVAAPMLARIEGRALVTDRHGWLAAAAGVAPVDRVLLPDKVDDERTWLPSFGPCRLEPVPGGWLVRLEDGVPAGATATTTVVLDVRGARQWRLVIDGPSGAWEQSLSPRHAELLLLLAAHPEGRTASELAHDVFADSARTVTVRAELSRLRRNLGGVLDHKPYRFAEWVDLDIRWPRRPQDLLAFSSSPGVRRLRAARTDGVVDEGAADED